MNKSFLITVLVLLIGLTTFAQRGVVPYLDKEGYECVLAYNSETGVSRRFYYNTTDKVFMELNAQVPLVE